jgi:futalosine hydrolase
VARSGQAGDSGGAGAVGCGGEGLARLVAGCSVVVLVATEVEAAPLLAALEGRQEYTVATKRLVAGRLRTLGQDGRRPGVDPGRRVVLAVTGCDKVNAAHALTCLLAAFQRPPRLVVQAGIAGALPPSGCGSGGKGPLTAAAGVGDLVVATQEAYSDTGSSTPAGWVSAQELGLPMALVEGRESGGVFPVDPGLVQAAMEALAAAGAGAEAAAEPGVKETPGAAAEPGPRPRIVAGPCVTSSQMTGTATEAEVLAGRWGALAESMEGAAAAHVCALHGVPFLELRGISNVVTDRDRAAWRVEEATAVSAWAVRAVVGRLDRLPLRPAGRQEGC